MFLLDEYLIKEIENSSEFDSSYSLDNNNGCIVEGCFGDCYGCSGECVSSCDGGCEGSCEGRGCTNTCYSNSR